MPRYTITKTWDGLPIDAREMARIDLTYSETGIVLHIDAPFHQDDAPTADIGSLWELWNYEVVEAFFVGNSGHYTELEFGPHGHYLVLRLDAPRSVIDKEHIIDFTASIEGSRWQGSAVIPSNLLPSNIMRLNFFSIHGKGDDRRYLCYSPLPHTHPDFHQPERFPLFTEASS